MSDVTHFLGLPAVAILALGLVALFFEWQIALYLWWRPVILAIGAALGAALYWFARRELNVLAWLYLVVIAALLLAHLIIAAVAIARADWRIRRADRLHEKTLHPMLMKALSYERMLSYPAAIVAYDEYLAECPSDVSARGMLGEALIKAGNAKRAIGVLTVAFTEAEDSKMKIAFGIRLAEVILVTERNPLAARAQLEQVRKLFAGTEHEKYVDRLSRRLMKRVAEGKYLKPKPKEP